MPFLHWAMVPGFALVHCLVKGSFLTLSVVLNPCQALPGKGLSRRRAEFPLSSTPKLWPETLSWGATLATSVSISETSANEVGKLVECSND